MYPLLASLSAPTSRASSGPAGFARQVLDIQPVVATAPVVPSGTRAITRAADVESFRLRMLQAIGTHNSYHVTPDNAILKLLTNPSTEMLLGNVGSEEIPSSWEATQAPLGTQFLNYGESHLCVCLPALAAFAGKPSRVAALLRASHVAALLRASAGA